MRVYSPLLWGKRAGSVTGGGSSVLTFAPAQPFAAGEALSVSLPPTLVSTGGTALSRHVFQFTAATGGTGRGFFVDTTHVGPTRGRNQVLGDLDNDGDLDLITTGGLFGCRVYLNNGAGRYAFKNGVVTGQEPRGPVLADVDQDGDLDLLVADATNAVVTVCLNDGTGEFIGSVTGAQNAPVGNQPVGVAVGDVDGDGDLDVAATQSTSGNTFVDIRLNDGIALATAPAQPGAPQAVVYPNPAQGQFTVVVPAELRPARALPGAMLQLFNAVGQLVLEQGVVLGATVEMQVSVAHLPADLYTLRLPLSGSVLVLKLAVQ